MERWQALLGPRDWPCYFLSNHDHPGHRSRYAAGRRTRARARVAAAMPLTLRGTPFLYMGAELGMASGRIRRSELRMGCAIIGLGLRCLDITVLVDSLPLWEREGEVIDFAIQGGGPAGRCDNFQPDLSIGNLCLYSGPASRCVYFLIRRGAEKRKMEGKGE